MIDRDNSYNRTDHGTATAMCLTGSAYAVGGGSVMRCTWNINGEKYTTETIGFGAGLEFGGGIVVVASEADSIDGVLGWSGCLGGGTGLANVEYCLGAEFTVVGGLSPGAFEFGGHLGVSYTKLVE